MSESYCHICNKPYRIIGLKSKMAEWCACKERIALLEKELKDMSNLCKQQSQNLNAEIGKVDLLEKAIGNYLGAIAERDSWAYPEPDERMRMAKAIDETQAAMFALIQENVNE